MFQFRKTNQTKSVMFAVTYDDGRTAYRFIENHGSPSEDYLVGATAREQQNRGQLREGTITAVKRVR
jgi:hypothetical protein